MGQRIGQTTKEFLIKAPLPQQTKSYTVISHEFVINTALTELKKAGFEIEHELYRCTINGEVAQGTYYLKHEGDPDMGLMFSWANSYDKSMKFKCAIGGYVRDSKAFIIGGEMAAWGRKHTGTADQETLDQIQDQVANAQIYFEQLVADKEAMKLITVSEREKAEIIGRMLLEKKLLSLEQVGVIKNDLKKSSFTYTGNSDSLWWFYNHIIFALLKSHPKTWMDQQRMGHWFICQEFNVTPVVGIQADPKSVIEPKVLVKQTNLIDMIAEIEAEQALITEVTVTEEVKSEKEEVVMEESPFVITEEEIEIIKEQELLDEEEINFINTPEVTEDSNVEVEAGETLETFASDQLDGIEANLEQINELVDVYNLDLLLQEDGVINIRFQGSAEYLGEFIPVSEETYVYKHYAYGY
jgi:hypothetical protein